MTSAIRVFETPIHALEIGTWYGEGSTQIWLQNLPAGSTLTLVDPWRPYGSAADMTDREFDYAAADRQVIEAYLSTIVAVRKFETAHPGRLSIDILRGDSERVLERLRDGIFDFIYVDGDHKYESVSRNLHDAKRLARSEFALDLRRRPRASAEPGPARGRARASRPRLSARSLPLPSGRDACRARGVRAGRDGERLLVGVPEERPPHHELTAARELAAYPPLHRVIRRPVDGDHWSTLAKATTRKGHMHANLHLRGQSR